MCPPRPQLPAAAESIKLTPPPSIENPESILRSFVRIETRLGILEKETFSGHEARRMGEMGLFGYLSETNGEMFEQTGVGHMVTGDPPGFYGFTHEYPLKRRSWISPS